jgi:hypothetical protein
MNKRGRVLGLAATAALTACVSAAILTTQAPASAAQATGHARVNAKTSTPSCRASNLGVWVAADQGDGTLGTIYFPLEFTNLSTHTCTLDGFPGVSAIDNTGQQLGDSADWDHSVPAQKVTLTPGATGYAMLAYHDAVAGSCPPADLRTPTELQIYPPNQTFADHAIWDSPVCTAPGLTNNLTVRVIAPGIGVRGDTG